MSTFLSLYSAAANRTTMSYAVSKNAFSLYKTDKLPDFAHLICSVLSTGVAICFIVNSGFLKFRVCVIP